MRISIFAAFCAAVVLGCKRDDRPPPNEPPGGYYGQPMAPAGGGRAPDFRASIAQVKVRPPKGIRNAFDAMSRDGDIAPPVREFAQGFAEAEWGGSGFVVQDNSGDGMLRIVTNRHVAAGGEEAHVSFDGGDSYQKADIAFISDDVDLAILFVSGQRPGFPLGRASEAQSVSAAGYPGLNGKPVWQVTQGNVSNVCLKESSFIADAPERCWLQHTAPIDPGSSGGPLLAGGVVVGVNTAFLGDRHSMFVALPSEHVSTALRLTNLARAHKGDAAWMRDELSKSCRAIFAELTSGSPKFDLIASRLSYRMVEKVGIDAVAAMDHPLMIQLFLVDPFRAMQSSLAFMIKRYIMGRGVVSADECRGINPNDDVLDMSRAVRITLPANGKPVEASFRFERGAWRLSDI
jgi:serine protease Do